MKLPSSISLNQRIETFTKSHTDKSHITQTIKSIKVLSDNLPKIDNDKKITTKTIVSKDLKTLSKQIDSVIKDAKTFLDKANSNNASIRPDQNESRSMQNGLMILKEQIANYKTSAFSVSNYKHNASKGTTLDKLAKKIGDMETKVTQCNIKNGKLIKYPETEKQQREQQSDERVTKRTDIKGNY